MNRVIKFEASDKRLFDNEQECIKHESMIDEIKKAMSPLKPVPKNTSFANGNGYVQQNKQDVEKAMIKIVEIANIKSYKDYFETFKKNPFDYRRSIIGRYLNDGGNYHLYHAWGRFMNMDESFKEWGQPYYALHPNAGNNFEIKLEKKDE